MAATVIINANTFPKAKEPIMPIIKANILADSVKLKYFGDAASLSTAGLTESKHFVQDFFLSPIPTGEIEIPGIEYDYDAATLRPKSKDRHPFFSVM